MRSSTTLSFLLLLLAGCSLLNAPNRDRITDDGGTDMEVADAGPLDARTDTRTDVPDVIDGGTDAGPAEQCDELGDEDGNGLSDCSDFACIGEERCCLNGMRTPINFMQGSPLWVLSGRVDRRERDDNSDVVFPGELPGTYMKRSCFPLAQGALFEVEIGLDTGVNTDCILAGDERCGDFVAFLLSTVNEAASGELIVAELGVRVYASGRTELYRERGEVDDVIEAIDIGPPIDRNIRIEFRVAPVVVDGVGVLRASVMVDNNEFNMMPTIPQSDLISECEDGISGLYFGIEGHGQYLSVRNAAAVESTLACTNPTQFRDTQSRRALVASAADLPGMNLGWREDLWMVADVTHPELVRVGTDGEPVWHVFGSTGPRQLEFSTLPDFPWTTAHSESATWNVEWSTPETHFVLDTGQQPTVVSDGSGLVFMAVVDNDVHYCRSPGDCSALRIDDGCLGLANPSLVATPDDNYLLFYQCTVNTNQTEVRGLVLGSRVTPVGTPFVVLPANSFGDLARNAIVDFDVLLDSRQPDASEYLVRAWFVGEALGNVRTLLLATGAIKLSDAGAEVDEIDDLKTGFSLVPYGANPIATENVLFRDPTQSLQGVSVERDGNSQDLLFLFGRRTERAEGRLYDFVPVEQTWGEL
ncbi:MAG: hypothetical protein ACI9KE_000367 [Polyangiales bacterium]|jgi:hypothetical protein